MRQTFKWSTVDGRPFVNIEAWILTLSQSEQEEFWTARQRQDLYRQQAIDAGLMVWDHTGDYVWRDQSAAAQGKATDDVWCTYFERWQQECQIKFETVFHEDRDDNSLL